jgi:hypothetical protein
MQLNIFVNVTVEAHFFLYRNKHYTTPILKIFSDVWPPVQYTVQNLNLRYHQGTGQDSPQSQVGIRTAVRQPPVYGHLGQPQSTWEVQSSLSCVGHTFPC